MEVKIKKAKESERDSDVLILPLFEKSDLKHYRDLDNKIVSLIKKVLSMEEFTGKHCQLTMLYTEKEKMRRVLLVGLGKEKEITAEKIRQAGGKALTSLKSKTIRNVAISAKVLESNTIELEAKHKPMFYFLEGAMLSLYKFDTYKKSEEKHKIKKILVAYEGNMPMSLLNAFISANKYARDLINTPANDMTPEVLESKAKSFDSKKVKVKSISRLALEKEGMNAFLSVAQGSNEIPKFITLEYKGATDSPVVLIGKSVTFDSGGLSLKNAAGMETMKYDMSGGATVLAVFKAVNELKLPVKVVAILPATENMPGGSASKPGNIVKTISGKTIEILNTDAEGRLTLADALGYATKYFKPKAIIDVATLTGACSVALGNEAIAMMGNSDSLKEELKKAAEETYERVWEMPLYDELKDYIKSDVADYKNIGGRHGGLITSGYFLKEFAGDYPWVHLDIAGTAWSEKSKHYINKGATGVGVRLLLQYFINNFSKKKKMK